MKTPSVASCVRRSRRFVDLVAPYSFNRVGFEWNQRGFEPDQRTSEGSGRVALVTGANAGIGRAAALDLARRGFDVRLLCRDRARGEEARGAIEHAAGRSVALDIVDVSSLASIRAFADRLPIDRVDVLVHNAGVMLHEARSSDSGVELTFATSVVGPFALTLDLLPRLAMSSSARVVFVASGGLYLQRLDLSLADLRKRSFDGTRAYANAKRAQVVLGHVLADRLVAAGPITFASMHPGWVDTAALERGLPRFHSLMRRALRTPEQGADTIGWLATSAKAAGTRGAFWFDRRRAPEYVVPGTRESAATRDSLVRLCELASERSIDEALTQAVRRRRSSTKDAHI